MFGHQDEKDDKKDDKENIIAPDDSKDTADTAVNTEPAAQTDQPAPADAGAADTATDTGDSADSTSEDDDAWQHPGTPIDDGPGQIADIIGPVGGGSPPNFKPPIVGGVGDHGYVNNSNNEDNTPQELIDIKQKALHQLLPLIDKLDQTPEDRFRTTMMIIQSSDDQSLVRQAYESANAIEDEKARGQALLDIVNEINYFTQQAENPEN